MGHFSRRALRVVVDSHGSRSVMLDSTWAWEDRVLLSVAYWSQLSLILDSCGSSKSSHCGRRPPSAPTEDWLQMESKFIDLNKIIQLPVRSKVATRQRNSEDVLNLC